VNSLSFYQTVVQKIRAQHSTNDLRNILIILPNFHVSQPLTEAFIREMPEQTVILPRMVTLNDWANTVPLTAPILPESQRSALLYRHLSQQPWFAEADLWAITQEMLTLFDELTHSLTRLPADAQAFAEAVQQAYQARKNHSLQLEAQLVFELWNAMQTGDELDLARAYQTRLATLSAQAESPLFVLRASDWTALETLFLTQYAERAPVSVIDLRELLPSTRNVISHALASQNLNVLAQSSQLQRDQVAPLAEKCRFFAANSLEHEARAAAMQIRLWLQVGKKNIAVVAQDRVVARRVRALLERNEIWVSDETGWTLDTLSVSTALERWLTALQSDFYHHDLLDLLKSPFIFADIASSTRKSTLHQLEVIFTKHNIINGLENYIKTIADENLSIPLLRLRQAASLFERSKRRRLSDWLQALNKSLEILAINLGWQQDAAGLQLIHALESWQLELANDKGLYAFSDWRRWLSQQLEQQNYCDSSIDSPVRFTHLAATRWRSFDAVLLVGCDSEHLPSVGAGSRWFNDSVRQSLNLPTRTQLASRQRDDLLGLLSLNDCVRITWQKEHNGETGLLSPYLQMLRDLHAMTYDDDLTEHELAPYLRAEEKAQVELERRQSAQPSIALEGCPKSISISAYNSLIACPYQYYARYILRLNELDEVQEGMEKRDYGDAVHRILQHFHQRFPLISAQPPAVIEAALREISEAEFQPLIRQNFSARAWLIRWLNTLPAYLAWQNNNEAEGWCYQAAECEFNLSLSNINLRGRVDRVDNRADEKRVIDYKTQSNQILTNKLKIAGEDVQLASYAFAMHADEAAFVSLEQDKVNTILPKQELSTLAQLNAERLQHIIEQIQFGQSLPANGVDASCAYCEMRGLCRKSEWR
jgi:ATP-dependent helicase/nuclease subunit B